MTREIKFRAQLTNSNEWVYGYYQFTPWKPEHLSRHIIITETGCRFSVKPETICQYVGFKVDPCEELYEGDIVEAGHLLAKNKIKGLIEYIPSLARFVLRYGNELNNISVLSDIKIIGNIIDNPMLLKQKKHKQNDRF